MGWFRKSEDEKWAEAKKSAHKERADSGQRVNRRYKNYTADREIEDQIRISRAQNKRRG